MLTAQTGKKTPAQLINRAWRSLQKGELDKAVSACRAVLSAMPDQFDATYVMGVVRLQQDRIAEARELLGAALRMRPDDIGALLNYGNLLARTGDPAEGLALYDKAIALKPDLAEAHVNRGNVLQELHRHDEAIASYEQALAFKPESLEALYGLGNAHFHLKRYEQALPNYDQVVSREAGHASAHNRRGLALFRLHRFEESEASHAQAVARQPRNAEFHTNHGTVLRALGRLADAEASYRRAMQFTKAYSPLLGDVGVIEKDGVRTLHLGTPVSQSSMIVGAPFDLVHPHARALLGFLMFNPRAREVLMIGLGGGSLPKFLHRSVPTIRTRAVEIDVNVISVARQHFDLPPDDDRLQVIQADGAQYLKDHPGSADALLLDIFDGLGTPQHLYSQEFFDDCRAGLAKAGVALVHLWSFDSQFALFVERIAQSFAGRILQMPVGETDSTVVVGFHPDADMSRAVIGERAALLETVLGMEFGDLASRIEPEQQRPA
ncbi:MAG: fused MFS/spermidine synthase [Reyranellaceae bacterium]